MNGPPAMTILQALAIWRHHLWATYRDIAKAIEELDQRGQTVDPGDLPSEWAAPHSALEYLIRLDFGHGDREDDPELWDALHVLREALDAKRLLPEDVLTNLIESAQRVNGLLGGNVSRWVLDGRKVTDDAAGALLSLHDHLTDVRCARDALPRRTLPPEAEVELVPCKVVGSDIGGRDAFEVVVRTDAGDYRWAVYDTEDETVARAELVRLMQMLRVIL